MNLANKRPTVDHVAFRDDAIALLRKHAGHLQAVEMLALAAHLTGQIVAMQDQRTMTGAMAMEVVQNNLQIGNDEACAQLGHPEGHG